MASRSLNASVESVLEKATGLVTPSPAEVRKLERIVSSVVNKIEEELERENATPRPQVELGGSYARGTWLKGTHDIDFFLLYPVDFSREKLESVAIRSASESLAGYAMNLRYAEHPYVESFVEGVRINIVPCYAVAQGEWRSAADRSPYHTKYIKSKLDERLRLEARLFKKFVKGSEVYGAEVKIQGFSGYVCEVLTIKFGSFLDTLHGVSELKSGEVISIEQFDKDLAASFKSPLVILDPVDTTRNLGSAISPRNVGKLVLQSRRFLAEPRIFYFHPKKVGSLSKLPEKSKQLLSNVLILSFRNQPRSPDILWGELKKSSYSLSDKLSRAGFQVLRMSAASNEKDRSALLFLLKENRVGSILTRQGPDYFRVEEVQKYEEKNRSRALLTWVGNEGKLESIFERERKLTEAETALNFMLQKKNIEGVGLSARIRDEVLGGFQVSTAEATRKVNNEEWLANAVVELLSSD